MRPSMCLIFLAFNIFIMCVAEPGMCSRCGEISKITVFNSFFKQKANCSKKITVLVEHHLTSTTACFGWFEIRGAQYQYFIINSISIILVSFLSIPISISIILKRAYQYQYLINFSKSSFINFNINLLYQCPTMILIRLPISYQLVIVLNINIDIN